MVENGANINAKDGDRFSPFHKVVKPDSTKILKYLIRNGAELKKKDIDGYDSVEVALSTKKQNAAKILFFQQINMF